MKIMNILLNCGVGGSILLVAGSVAAADLYRCTIKDGPAIYSDYPCGTNAVVVGKVPDTRVIFPSRLSDNSRDVNVNVTVNNSLPAASVVRESDELRGLPFERFRLLDRGMSEGEILAIAGPPQRETLDAVNDRLGFTYKSYYYVSEGYNANITRIQFTNGTVTQIDRNLRPY